MEQRAYQSIALNDCRAAYGGGSQAILLVAPTGSGKTVIAAQIVRAAQERGRRILFLAHRRELVYQCGEKLRAFGVDHGIVMAGELPELYFEVQVASIDTLRARCLGERRKMPLPEADLVIIDEAHRAMAPTYQKLITEYRERGSKILGLTATPIRGDGKGLGASFEAMVQCPSVAELTRMGYLVPVQYFAPTIPDLTGVEIKRGDYDETQLQALLNRRELVGDVVTNWARLAPQRPTIVFATGVAHSLALRDEYRANGFRAEHIDADTPLNERADILKGLKNGDVQIITNCMVLTEGFDEPILSCCVLARPTKNVGLFLQMAGRALRPAPGKTDCLILDHSGNVYEHGFVGEEREWQLTTGKALTENYREKTPREVKPITCVRCAHVYTGRVICPACGYEPKRTGRYLETRDADLARVDEERRVAAIPIVYRIEDKQRWYSMLLDYAQKRNKKLGWVAHTYRHKFGVWPRNMPDIPLPPDPEVLAYIRHRNIAYARRQA